MDKTKIFVLIIFICILLGVFVEAGKIYNPGYTFGNQQLVIGVGSKVGTKIVFNPKYDLKAFFCIGEAEIPDAEDISFNKNTVTIKGRGACAFKLETRV